MKKPQGISSFGRTTSRTTGIALSIALGIVGAGSLAACGAIDIAFDVDGSGESETVSYDFDSFDRVDLGSAFESTITIESGEPSVEITLDDNLFEHLNVEVSNGKLSIDMDNGMYDHKVDPVVTITMPSIVELDVSGATNTKVSGIDETELEVDTSGAANLELNGSADKLKIDSSGASTIEADGSADDVELESSGAASVDLDDFTANTVDVDLSGASSVELGDVSQVTGELSGASSLEVPESTNVSASTSGASSVERR